MNVYVYVYMMIMLTKRSQRIQRCRKEIEPPVQSSVNPQNMETTAGEQRDQHPKGSNLTGEGGDLLRIEHPICGEF